MLPAVDARRPVGSPVARGELGLAKRTVIEGVGTAFLLAVIVGSGIAGERLAGGNAAIALLANSTATGAGLAALILALGPLSGAHLNPAVTLADVVAGRPARELLPYVSAQLVGAFIGVAGAEAMFGVSIFQVSTKARPGAALVLSEAIATFGLLAIASLASRQSLQSAALGVGAYIAAAYWFTSSTSFANPAVTLARSMTNTFTGIRPADVPGFLVGQTAGLAAFVLVARRLRPREE